jgi:hypothetical protein
MGLSGLRLNALRNCSSSEKPSSDCIREITRPARAASRWPRRTLRARLSSISSVAPDQIQSRRLRSGSDSWRRPPPAQSKSSATFPRKPPTRSKFCRGTNMSPDPENSSFSMYRLKLNANSLSRPRRRSDAPGLRSRRRPAPPTIWAPERAARPRSSRAGAGRQSESMKARILPRESATAALIPAL